MTEKNIFVYKHFLSLNISDFSLIFFCKTANPPEKSYPLFSSNLPLKVEVLFLDKIIKWFHSYLTNRAFFVSLGTVFLEAGTINCEVPQGSILGPLFLLYINDIAGFVKYSYVSV